MCFHRLFFVMHGISLLGVSFTCVSHDAAFAALAPPVAKSASAAEAQSVTTQRVGLTLSHRLPPSDRFPPKP